MAKSIVITISRQYGSGGRLIGKKLAEKFDIPFYDKELIELAVEESGFSKEIFEKVDERASSSLLYTLSVTPGLMHGGLSGMTDLPLNDKVFLVQTKIIKDGAYVRLIDELVKGDRVEIDTNPRHIRITKNGVNVLNKTDRGSRFTGLQMTPGTNTVRYEADYGDNNLHVVLRYNKQYLGV